MVKVVVLNKFIFEIAEYDTSVVGEQGKGYSWLHIEDDEENVIPSLTGGFL